MLATHKDTPQRANFTKSRIDRFTCPPKRTQAFLWDTTVSGLGLRATVKGACTYIFQTRLHGRTVRHTIGSPDAWDIAEARAEARRLRVLVDSGVHPRDEKRQREQTAKAERQRAERDAITLGDVWPQYIEARRAEWSALHLKDHHKMMQPPGEKRLRSSKRTVAGPLHPLRNARLTELTPELLRDWLERESRKRPTVAATAYRLLRACITWVSEQPEYRGGVDPRALFSGTVRRAVPKPRAKTDALQREQLAPWFEAVRAINNLAQSAYLQALLLTGARRNELAAVRWEDVDFAWRSLVVKDKVEGERVIPLTPYVSALLGGLPRRNQYVFSSPTARAGYLTAPTRVHARAVSAAGLPPLTVHGLRRSFGSLAEWSEVPLGVTAQIMGHAPSALVERHYRRRPLDLLRRWHELIEAFILGEAGIAQPNTAETAALRVVK